MDFESTLETVAAYLPEDVDLSGILSNAVEYIPTDISFGNILKFLLFFSLCSLILGIVGRAVLGKRSSLNHSLSSVMGILFIYALTIIIYTFKPMDLVRFLSPLPFVTFAGEHLIIFPFIGADFTVICYEVLSMIILAFLVNLLDSLLPQGNRVISWYLLRITTVICSMALHFLVRWAFNTYLPHFLVMYAPTILLFVLIGMILIGFFNAILGIFLTVMNPVIGAIYTFFFSNLVGKQVTKAVFCTFILSALVYLFGLYGYTVIHIDMMSLTAYLPLLLVCGVLWFLIGHFL